METASGTALDRILEITSLLGDDMRRHLATLGLTESRTHLLYLLGSDGPCTQRELAEALAVAPRTVTGLVDGLVGSGHVTREPHPTDRRATLVTPTEDGAAVAAGLVASRGRLAEQLFVDWVPERIDDLVDGLDDVLDTLRALLDGDSR